MALSSPSAVMFHAGPFEARELLREDLPELQAFFEANPEYFLTVSAAPPKPDEAQELFDDRPPAGMPYSRLWVVLFCDAAQRCVAMAQVVADLFAPRVWHIGLFIVAGELHGSGAAATLYQLIERFAREGGADWMRLGVVAGNAKAERFWNKMGLAEVRRREGMVFGEATRTVRVMVKPLTGGSLDAYLVLVERDRPDKEEHA